MATYYFECLLVFAAEYFIFEKLEQTVQAQPTPPVSNRSKGFHRYASRPIGMSFFWTTAGNSPLKTVRSTRNRQTKNR